MKEKDFQHLPDHFGMVSRRDFVKFCGVAAASMGLPLSMGIKIAEAVASPKRPPVIWLSGQECTGCTETLLRSTHPTVENSDSRPHLPRLSRNPEHPFGRPGGRSPAEIHRRKTRANSSW